MKSLSARARFYADRNIDQSIVYVLRHERFDVETAADPGRAATG
jgi:hypothetical protein